jgi:hypothetical protein
VTEMTLEMAHEMFEVTTVKIPDSWLETPIAFASPLWMPAPSKLVTWLAMQHMLASDSRTVHEQRVRIRVKPSMGLFATEALKKGARFPVASNSIITCDKAELQVAAWHCSDRVHIVPTRPHSKTSKDGSVEIVWNAASAVRLVPAGAGQAELNMINAKMTVMVCPLVTSCGGKAREFAGVVPTIELTDDVCTGMEIVSSMDEDIYSKPVTKQCGVKRIGSVQPKVLKRIHSDTM